MARRLVQPVAGWSSFAEKEPSGILRGSREIRYIKIPSFISRIQLDDPALIILSLGSIARIGPDTVITNDVELMRRISAARSPYVRSDWYKGMRFEPGVDHIFSMMDETAHTKRRAQMTNGVGFSGTLTRGNVPSQ